ncbi:hypothetical protein [Nostoc sp. NIES-3756]|uniref:hypothetical protein n=1 Tax=Nostoc sp. NIES-3756 TaxID=1751286 RepID=UPI00149530C0|nr:hypothetical protein [Nostoc sp. NIES-3756]
MLIFSTVPEPLVSTFWNCDRRRRGVAHRLCCWFMHKPPEEKPSVSIKSLLATDKK